MKERTYTILIALFFFILMPVKLMAQEEMFEKFNDAEGVTTVYISRTMMQMIHNVKAGKHNIGNISSKLDQLRVLTCERRQMATSIKKQFVEYYKKNQYEVIMQANESNEHSTIYHKNLKGGKAEFSLLTEDDGEINIIYVKGDVTLKDIQQITGN